MTDPQAPPIRVAARSPLLKIYLGMLSVATLCLGVLDFKVANGWIIGDWLINYRGGFVRRGLTGEIALRFAHLFHVSPELTIMPLLLGLYGILFYVVWRMLAFSNFNLWVLLYLLSPATLAFHLLDPPEAFHKEEMHFAGLGILLLLLTSPRVKESWLIVYLSLVCTASILCHEGLLFFMPYYFAALVIGLRNFQRALRVAALPAIFSVAAAALASAHRGNLAIAEQICTSLNSTITEANVGICGGSIYFLHTDAQFSRYLVRLFIKTWGYYTLYPQLVLLAALPLLFAHRALWKYFPCRRDLKILYVTIAVSCVGSVPLFIYATAWGRWIYIHALSIFLVLLFIDYRRQLDPATHEGIPEYRTNRKKYVAGVALVAMYALLWDLPGEGLYPARFGVFGLLHYALKYRLPHTLP